MAYKIDISRQSGFSNRTRLGLVSLENSSARGADHPNTLFYELEPAEVLDIILDTSHEDYKDYRDIGRAKVRLIYTDYGKDEVDLPYARPLDSNFKSYPLLHEIVVVVEYLGQLYYTQRLNILGSVNHNSFPFVSLPPVSVNNERDSTADGYDDIIISGAPNVSGDSDNATLGDVFVKNSDILPLRPFEGDQIFEGRVGNSIRMGSNPLNGSPTIKIRVGQPNAAPSILSEPYIVENINDDGASIWMTDDDTVNLIPATGQSSVHLKFAVSPPNKFEGKQIVLNGDRIIVNCKQSEMMVFANKAINMVTLGEITLESNDKFITNSTSDTVVNAPKIFLGADTATEPIVLGNKLVEWLDTLTDILLAHTHNSGTGPTTPLNPPQLAELNQLKGQINTVLSGQNFSL